MNPERPFYLEGNDCQLYHVFHEAAPLRAAALLVGPFPTERPYAYTPWVRWARHLAAHDVAALRFDYRGAGESTGEFAEASIATWIADAGRSLEWLRAAAPGVPVVLHGLGFGGLIAAHAFAGGAGNALLLWSAPASAEEAMKEILMRRVAADFKADGNGKRKTWQDYVAELNAGQCVDVMGYPISGRLWQEAAAFANRAASPDTAAADGEPRPKRVVKLDRRAAPLIAGIGQWRAMDPNLQTGRVPLEPDLSGVFGENMNWIEEVLSSRNGLAG
jgi:alpha/beta superfamily hydrolase